jgi:hypothetical protein
MAKKTKPEIQSETPPEEEDDWLICMAVNPKIPALSGSIKRSCALCQTTVWVSVSGQKAMRGNAKLVPVCMKCGEEKLENDPEASPLQLVPGAMEELQQYLREHPPQSTKAHPFTFKTPPTGAAAPSTPSKLEKEAQKFIKRAKGYH